VRDVWQLLGDRPSLRRLLAAALVSLTGDWVLRTGLAFFVYELTGSTKASAVTWLSSFLPFLLVGSVAGVYVDRWDRRRTLLVTHLLMALGLAPLLLVHTAGDVWVVYAVTLVEAVLALFAVPAQQALLPALVPADRLATANALTGQTRDVAMLVGPALGGVLVAAGGVAPLAIADAATFVAAAQLVAGIDRSSGAVLDTAPRGVSGLSRLAQEWGDGLRVAMSRTTVRVVFVYTLLAMTGEGVMGTLFAPFVRDVLHGDGSGFGLLTSAQAIGGVAGAFVAVGLAQRVSPVAMFGIGAVLFGLVDLVLFLDPTVMDQVPIWPALLCLVVVGVPGAVAMTGYNTLLQRDTPAAYRGRVLGALGIPQGAGILLGTVAAGALGDVVGIVPVIIVQGLSGVFGGIVVLTALRNQVVARPVPVGAPDGAG
jgi:Na+/melibiose symporter-like transporter